MKNRAARGGSEGDNDKVPSTSKFHFSKGKYGNIVLAWHGVLIQKAKANFPDICAQARKILGATDLEIGKNDNERALNVNSEVRTRVGLDSESESEEESSADGGDHEDNGNENSEDDRNSVIDYHGNDGNDDTDDGHGNDSHNDDADDGHGNNSNGNNDDADDGNAGHNVNQNDTASDPSRSEYEVVYNAEKNDGGKETEEVELGPSRCGGRHGTKASGRK